MKIVLLVLPTLHAGGTENYVLRLLKYAGKSRFEWHVISLDLVRGDLHDSFLEAGAHIHYQSLGYANLLKLMKFYSLLKTFKVDTVCTFIGNFGGEPLMVARIAGVKTRIGWYRATEPAYKPTFLRRKYDCFVKNLLWANSTLVLSNSDSAIARNRPTSVRIRETKIIDNGVDPELFQSPKESKEYIRIRLGINPRAFTVCHVGRFDPAKNHETIFRTIAEARKRVDNFQFIFCGRGTDSMQFLTRLKQEKIDDITYRFGLRTDLQLIYAASDLMYFPSLTEGQPNALIEAMLCQVPILASNINPIKEVLPSECHDALIDPYDWKLAADRIVTMARCKVSVPNNYRDYAVSRFHPDKSFNSFLKYL